MSDSVRSAASGLRASSNQRRTIVGAQRKVTTAHKYFAGPSGRTSSRKERVPPARVATVDAPAQQSGEVSAPAKSAGGFTRADYASLFQNYAGEEDYVIDDVVGTLPSDLEGTFYRNGPGILELGGERMHVFDAHGLVARVAIKNGRAFYRSRFTKTKAYREEVEQGKVLYRGFGTQKPGGIAANAFDIRDKPVANTALQEWGGKLWALWEADRPMSLDPTTLETLGEEDLHGYLYEGQAFSAHPHYDPSTDRLVTFSNGIRHGEGILRIYELSREGSVVQQRSLPLPLMPPTYLHDFQVTPNWYIFFKAPLGLRWEGVAGYLLGANDQTKQVRFAPELGGEWLLVPRNGGEPVRVPAQPQFIWHYGNAFEDTATGRILVDACTFQQFDMGAFDMRDPTTIDKSIVIRAEIDPVSRTTTQRTLLDRSADLPAINEAFKGNPNYRYMYVGAVANDSLSFPYQSIVKLDVTTGQATSWTAPEGCFVGEALFAARKGANSSEDYGYLVTTLLDGRGRKSSVAILDAQTLETGPIAELRLKNPLPMGFHCLWSDKYHGPQST